MGTVACCRVHHGIRHGYYRVRPDTQADLRRHRRRTTGGEKVMTFFYIITVAYHYTDHTNAQYTMHDTVELGDKYLNEYDVFQAMYYQAKTQIESYTRADLG